MWRQVVSRSPRYSQDQESFREYRAAWRATMRLLREGHSFSGREPNCVFLNCRSPRFANVSAVTGLDFPDDGRAVGVTDWDHDGDLDVWLSNRTGPRLRLMRNQLISNEIPSDARYVAFRLQGTVSNRDAIGARVEVVLASPTARPLIQTLTAGDAFLSQSTKWLHFGLGRETEIQEVTVRWPTGQTERFVGIQSCRRYHLIEGTGKATEVPPRRGTLALAPSTQPTLPPTQARRTFYSNRLPIPILRYHPFDGSETQIVETHDRPLLVNLWASWCAPCVAELKAFQENADLLRTEGLDILCLSLDGLDQGQRTQPQDAKRLLDDLGFSFAAGVATREMLDKLHVAEGALFNRQPGLVVPTSFLLDANGGIAVSYHGPVLVTRLLDDLRQLRTPLYERRDLAVPLPGRWTSPPRQLLLRAVARVFQDGGYAEDFARYLQLDAGIMERQRRNAASDEERRQLDIQYAAANYNLGLALVSSGEAQEAFEYFQRAVEVNPDHVDALVNLGAMLAQGHKLDGAIKALSRAVDLKPDSVPARMNLAAALGAKGEFGQASEHYRHLLEIQPNAGKVHARLARALLETGKMAEAAEHLQQAVGLDSRDFPSTLSLAWLRATCPVESLRDGAQAVRLAEQLKRATAGKNPLVLDVLSAGYAEQGDFAAARALSTQALERLGTKQKALQSVIRARLEDYGTGKPYRDKDGKYP